MGPKMAPLGASLGHLAFQDGAKVDKKSIPKSIKKTMPLGIDFLNDFGRSWGAKWDQVGIKIDPKSMLTSKSDLFKKPCFSLGKTNILTNQGVQVGSPSRSKIDLKMMSKKDAILASIFHRCWSMLVDFGSQVGTENLAKWGLMRSGQVRSWRPDQVRSDTSFQARSGAFASRGCTAT